LLTYNKSNHNRPHLSIFLADLHRNFDTARYNY
jgi:hypothetical protein